MGKRGLARENSWLVLEKVGVDWTSLWRRAQPQTEKLEARRSQRVSIELALCQRLVARG